MFGLEKLIGYPLGWIMYFIYCLVKNYGIAIVIFTVITRLIVFPVSYNQQKSNARMQKLNPKLEKLKKSFMNNPQRLQEEQMKLYSEEGINPMASCLPMFLQFLILFGVIDVVYRPLTHVLRIPKATITEAKSLLSAYMSQNGITDKYFASRPELTIMNYLKSNPEIFRTLDGFSDKVDAFKNSFLGIDLGAVPTLHPEVWNNATIGLVMIPILSGLFQLILTIYMQVKQKQNNPDMPSMGAMNIMFYIMPVFSVWFAFQVPAGVGFYWAVSSLVAFVQSVGLNMYFTPERTEKILAKDKERNKKKKKSGFMKMMEDAQNAAANNTAAVVRDENTEGMSRAELQNYNRQKINEARKRMAEKYGDEYDESDDNDE